MDDFYLQILEVWGEVSYHNKLGWAPLMSRGSLVQDLGTLALALLPGAMAAAGAGEGKGGCFWP